MTLDRLLQVTQLGSCQYTQSWQLILLSDHDQPYTLTLIHTYEFHILYKIITHIF